MICPRCRGLQRCPCKHCARYNKDKTVWVCLPTSIELSACGYCGLVMSIDSWMEAEWQQYKEAQADDSHC